MSPSDYTEELLVEQPAVDLFAELGWATVSAAEEVFGSAEPSPQPPPSGRGGWLGRETKSEVVLIPRLRAALERLNPALPADAINSAITELARDRSAMSLAGANREIWDLLRDCVKVSVADRERGGLKTERARVVDWDNPQANDFLLVSQMTITAVPFTIGEKKGGYFDLSKIDFEALRKKFDKNKPTNTDLERFKAAVRAQLERMVRLNRADYLEKFQELIESYNAGSRNIEEIFRELLNLSSILTEEQTRHVRENLTEEELTVFDILTRPGPDLSAQEREEVKKVASQLLERLKELLVIGWRQRVGSRARVRLAIEDALDDGLPRAYSKELFQTKCMAVFEHVYESYQGEGKSVYSESA